MFLRRERPVALSATARRHRVMLHLGAVAGSWLVHLTLGNPVVTLVTGGLLMTLTFIKLGFDELDATPLGLSPLSFYFFWNITVVGLCAAYAGSLISSGQALKLGPWSVPPKDVAAGYLIFLTGSVALHAGFQYSRPADSHEPEPLVGNSNARFLMLLGVMYVIGISGLVIPPLTNALGSNLSVLVLYAPITALSSFALATNELALSRISFSILLFLGTIGLLLADLNEGSKSDIMFSFLPLFWLLLVHHRRWLPLFGVLAILFYSVVWQVVTLSRLNAEYYEDLGSLTERTNTANRVVDAFNEWLQGARVEPQNSEAGSTHLSDEFFLRQFQPLSVGFITHEVGAGGLLMGAKLAYVGYGLVPRILWPDKPRINQGGWFSFMLGLSDSPDSASTNTAQYAAGELYWNFGLPGVVVGMALIGALLGRLWQMAGNDPHRDPLRMMLYIVVMLSLQEMSEAGTVLTGIISQYVVFGTALRLQATLRAKNTKQRVSTRAS